MQKQLTEDKATELIFSLQQMRGFPTESAAIKRLVDALMLKGKEPVEEAIAVAAVDSFADDADADTQCPMPKDIRAAVSSQLEDFRHDPECKICQGSGDEPVFRKDPRGGEDIRESRVCKCLARRPAPVWEKESEKLPKDHVPAEFAEGIRKAVKGVVQ